MIIGQMVILFTELGRIGGDMVLVEAGTMSSVLDMLILLCLWDIKS